MRGRGGADDRFVLWAGRNAGAALLHLISYRTICGDPEWARLVVYRRLADIARRRGPASRRAVGESPGMIVAKLADGPLSGSTREVAAVEGRPPKTIDIGLNERSVRYCLAHWEQSGQSAVYAFLYDV